MLNITESISIPLSEIKITFLQASGPGGQNVNKVASAVQLRFDVMKSTSLLNPVKFRLALLAGSRINKDGILVIEAHRYRTQEQNRADALKRLAALVVQATKSPKARRVSRPSNASRAERLKAKRRRGELKRLRRGSVQEN